MKVTLSGLSSSDTEKVLTLFRGMNDVTMLMENESFPLRTLSSTTSSEGGVLTTVSFDNGVVTYQPDSEVTAKSDQQQYWIYYDAKGVAKAVHLIKPRMSRHLPPIDAHQYTNQDLTYCGIVVIPAQVTLIPPLHLQRCHTCVSLHADRMP